MYALRRVKNYEKIIKFIEIPNFWYANERYLRLRSGLWQCCFSLFGSLYARKFHRKNSKYSLPQNWFMTLPEGDRCDFWLKLKFPNKLKFFDDPKEIPFEILQNFKISKNFFLLKNRISNMRSWLSSSDWVVHIPIHNDCERYVDNHKSRSKSHNNKKIRSSKEFSKSKLFTFQTILFLFFTQNIPLIVPHSIFDNLQILVLQNNRSSSIFQRSSSSPKNFD